MKHFHGSIVASLAFVCFVIIGSGSPLSTLAASPAVVNVASAGNYVILSKTAITTTGVTSVTGDIAVSPAFAATMTGFAFTLDVSGAFSTSALITGEAYAADYAVPTPATLTTAVLDMQNAYTDALSRPVDVTDAGAGDLAGLSLVTGVYTFSGPGNVVITSDVTLNGSATDVWIFQIPGTLNISADKKILLTGGALASNVFWAVAGTSTLQPGSTFEGVILGGPGASTIALQSGAILNGRALGQTDVTLIANTISAVAPVVSTPVTAVVTQVAWSAGAVGSSGPASNSTDPAISAIVPNVTLTNAAIIASNAVSVVAPLFPNAGFAPVAMGPVSEIMVMIIIIGLVSIPLGMALVKNGN